ncbi:Hypothetical predicted protein, partial [Olea europaea subsp. europaea]
QPPLTTTTNTPRRCKLKTTAAFTEQHYHTPKLPAEATASIDHHHKQPPPLPHPIRHCSDCTGEGR